MISTIDIADLLEAELKAGFPGEQPEGSITINQYRKIRGVSKTAAWERLEKLVEKGLARRIKWPSSRGKATNAYFLNKKAKKQ